MIDVEGSATVSGNISEQVDPSCVRKLAEYELKHKPSDSTLPWLVFVPGPCVEFLP